MATHRQGRHPRKLSKTDRKVLRQFTNGDISNAEAAKLIDCSLSSVYKWATEIAPRPWRRFHRSKVNAVEAQKLYEDGWTLCSLGTRYGVSRERVRQRINTKVAVRKTPYQRPCAVCGQPFLGAKGFRFCEGCKAPPVLYDRCECGRRKRQEFRQCQSCRSRTFPWDAAASLYRLGYGLHDIAALFNVSDFAVRKALIKLGVALRAAGGGEAQTDARQARERRPIHVALRLLR